MTIQELEKRYYFHDSGINKIDYNKEKETLVFAIDLCYWAQEWYKEGEPELMEIKLTFEGIKEYDGLTGDIDCFTVLDGIVEDGKWRFNILDDFHNDYYEYTFSPTNVEVEHIRVFED